MTEPIDAPPAQQSFPRSALVTGAGGGIGGAAAIELARRGAVVGVADVRLDDAQAVVETIRGAGGDAYAVQVDVANLASVRAMFAQVDSGAPPLDLLVNAAGVLRKWRMSDAFTAESEQDLEDVLNINVKGSFWCLQEAASRMAPRRQGNIVNIASVASFVGARRGLTAYSTSKGAVRLMTIGAAAELGEFGIRVNAVAPGTVPTNFVASSLNSPEAIAKASEGMPLGRLASVEDVANAIAFLASPEAGYITGHVLVVDGGRLTS